MQKVEKNKDYLIIGAKVEIRQVAPFESVIGVVEFDDNGVTKFLYLWEYDGMPQFHLSDKDIWEALENPENHGDALDATLVLSLEDVDLDGEYDDIVPKLKTNRGADGLLLFLIALVCCPSECIDKVLKVGLGKKASEVAAQSSCLKEAYK